MTNTVFDNQGSTSISIQVNETSEILFQACQFFVNTAIYILSEASSSIVCSIRMANCFISKAIAHSRNISGPFIDADTKVLLRVWNVTIYTNNTYYISCNENIDRYMGDDIVIEEFCYAAGNTLNVKEFHIYLYSTHILKFRWTFLVYYSSSQMFSDMQMSRQFPTEGQYPKLLKYRNDKSV